MVTLSKTVSLATLYRYNTGEYSHTQTPSFCTLFSQGSLRISLFMSGAILPLVVKLFCYLETMQSRVFPY